MRLTRVASIGLSMGLIFSRPVRPSTVQRHKEGEKERQQRQK